jgi:hypothetical protein
MSVDEQKTLLKIRTFATDLVKAKGKAGLTATEDEIAAGKKVDLDVAKKQILATEKHLVTVTKKKEVGVKSQPVVVKVATPGNVVKPEMSETPKSDLPSVTQAKIPAFHEIRKDTHKDISVVYHSTPPIRHGDAPSRKRHDFTSTTTIITDSRHVGDPFLVRLSKSLNQWFSSLKYAFKKRTTPTYAVEDSGRRRGVVQKATTKTGVLFTADNETLREEIRRRQARQQDEPDISWSPNTETGFALLESGEDIAPLPPIGVRQSVHSAEDDASRWEVADQDTPIASENQSSPAAVTVTSQAIKEKLELEAKLKAKTTLPPVQIVEPIEPVSPLDQVRLIDSEPQETIQEQPVVQIPQESFSEPVSNNRASSFELIPTETYAPQINPIQSILNLIQGKSKFTDTNTNALAMGGAALIAAVVIIVIVAKIVIGMLTPSNVSDTTVEATPIIDKVSVTQVVLSETSQVGLETLLKNEIPADSSFNEIEIVDVNKQPLSTSNLLDLLNLSINPNFKQSVSAIHFVTVDGNKWGIVFKVNDSITALGALLTWENQMGAELQTLMKLSDLPSETGFIDETLFETDVRVLRNGGTDFIVYGFVSENIVLIVPDMNSFQRALMEQF